MGKATTGDRRLGYREHSKKVAHDSNYHPHGQMRKDKHHPNPGHEKGRHPYTNNSGGEGHDSNNITMTETLRIVSMNTKQGWIPLSPPTCHHTTKGQNAGKEETTGHTCKVSQLDLKRKWETAKDGAARVGNYPKKEDIDRRPTATVRVCNRQRLPPG